jgi:Icc-related predicted phosphoesterase
MANKVKVLTVADLHRNEKLYTLLVSAIEKHKPDVVALVGDFLDATGETNGKLSVDDCAHVLSRLSCPETVFVRGNHEASTWWGFADAWQQSGRELHLLEGACFNYGPLVMVGFPCLMLQGTGIGPDLPGNPDKWLPKLLRPHLPAARALWLMHEPPHGTVLSERVGPLSGQVEWRLAIERFLPRLVIFGHDHRTPIQTKQWNCQLGATPCVNVGQTDNGPLRYAVVEMCFPQNTPCLPRSIVVTAYPEGKSFAVPR